MYRFRDQGVIFHQRVEQASMYHNIASVLLFMAAFMSRVLARSLTVREFKKYN